MNNLVKNVGANGCRGSLWPTWSSLPSG